MVLHRLLKSPKAKSPDFSVKEEETSNGPFLAMEETASWKEQGHLLKAEKLATGEPAPFHHTLSNYISRFMLFRLVGHIFPLGESTPTRVSGKKSGWPMVQTFLWLHVLSVHFLTWGGHKEEA